MANPTKPDIDYSYTGFQQEQQDFPFPGTQLDNDLAELKRGVDDTIDALADVRRADGALQNKIVTPDSLSDEVLIGVPEPTEWATATDYAPPATVYAQNGVYRCVQAHTSGVFADDLSAGYWEIILDLSSVVSDAEAARDQAVAAAGASEVARDTSVAAADTATTQAGIATTQAGVATTQAGTATTQANASAASADLAALWADSVGQTPGGPGTKSAREWASDAELAAGSIPTLGTTGRALAEAETQAEAQTALDVYSRTEVDGFFDYITPAMFGAIGDGIEDDTTALQNMLSDGRPVEWGGASKTYRITSGLSVVPSDPVIWRSHGASIILDSGSSIQTAVMVNTPGHDVDVIGRLRLDCQQKAFIGFFFQNSSGTFCDFSGKGLQVRNVYRASTAFTGGDGIWIRGGFRNIYLERPDVRGVLMANGAGVSGSQGVTGISVTAMTLSPQEVTIVHPWVEGVYSEDASYLVDQDGIKIFGAEDDDTVVLFEGHFSLFGGKIRNCGGRSVKSQMEYGQIVGTQFSRDGVEVSEIAREGSMPEIDFQTGGGLVENIECNYRGSAPNRIVQLTGSRQETPIRYGAGAKVDGIRISRTGSHQLYSLVDIAPKFMRSGIIDIKNINQIDSNLLKSHAIRIGDEPTNSATLLVNVENLNARVNSGSSMKIVNVSRTVGTTHLVGRNVWSTQSGTSFAATAGGTITQTLEGKNINVV